MLDRLSLRALFFVALALPLAGCTNPLVDNLSISPTAQNLAVGQTAQFSATGTIGHGNNHPPTTGDVTDQASWSSSNPAVATITATGLATALSAGSTTITAKINGYTGLLTAAASITVSSTGGGTGTITGITSLAVIPGSQAVQAPGNTAQFLAIGTSASGSTADLTTQVTWLSSSVQIATVVGTTGLATAVGQGADTITAIYTNPGNGGSTITGSATFTVVGGNSQQYTSVTIIPNAETVSASSGKGNFIALATLGNGLKEDVTNSPSITWLSSQPNIASVTTGLATGNGVVTGAGQGNTSITVELANPASAGGSIVSDTATVSVTMTPPTEPLLSLQIIPGSIAVGNLQDTGNFMAIGTYSVAPYVRDLTNDVVWLSSAPDIFPVSSDCIFGANPPCTTNPGAPGGVATAYGSSTGADGATIIAEATDPNTGSIQTATAIFGCPLVLPNPPTTAGSCYPGSEAQSLLATITVYNEGLNTANWLVTAPSATGTANAIHCGPGWTGAGGSVCTASYPVQFQLVAGNLVPVEFPITLTATGGNFGGWSYSCNTINPDPSTQAGPNTCTVDLGGTGPDGGVISNVTVGAVFN